MRAAKAVARGEFDGRLDAVVRVGAWYFALDGRQNRLARAPVSAPGALQPLDPVAHGSGRAASLAALADQYLLATTPRCVRAFRVGADGGLTPAWTLEGDFGGDLYVAVSGRHLAVTDGTRHRLVLFAWAAALDVPPERIAQYGETDQPGNDYAHPDSPTLVSLCGIRAVVYDSGNQRVVKLVLR